MKTPDEIKKGLEACIAGECNSKRITCPYRKEADCTTTVIEDALAYIRQLETKVPQWISVNERLPDNNEGEMLVAGADGEVTTAECMNGMIYFRVGSILVSAVDVTHWMPLPEPPEDEKNG